MKTVLDYTLQLRKQTQTHQIIDEGQKLENIVLGHRNLGHLITEPKHLTYNLLIADGMWGPTGEGISPSWNCIDSVSAQDLSRVLEVERKY